MHVGSDPSLSPRARSNGGSPGASASNSILRSKLACGTAKSNIPACQHYYNYSALGKACFNLSRSPDTPCRLALENFLIGGWVGKTNNCRRVQVAEQTGRRNSLKSTFKNA
jgi:hypothetical protein